MSIIHVHTLKYYQQAGSVKRALLTRQTMGANLGQMAFNSARVNHPLSDEILSPICHAK